MPLVYTIINSLSVAVIVTVLLLILYKYSSDRLKRDPPFKGKNIKGKKCKKYKAKSEVDTSSILLDTSDSETNSISTSSSSASRTSPSQQSSSSSVALSESGQNRSECLACARFKTLNTFVQTEDIFKDAEVQASIIPKIPFFLEHQQMQSKSIDRGCQDNLENYFLQNSDLHELSDVTFGKVISLPVHRVNRLGQQEERAFRLSLLLNDRESNEESSKENVSFYISPIQSNSKIESYVAQLKENMRFLPIHKNLISPVKETLKFDSEANKNEKSIQTEDDQIPPDKNDKPKTLQELKEIYSPTKVADFDAEPVKAKKFPNYLKNQYRNIEEETFGKSFALFQDLKQVLQKREEDRGKLSKT